MENEALIEMNAELESAIEELEKEVEMLEKDRNRSRSDNPIYDVSSSDIHSRTAGAIDVEATFYTAFCSTGCIGITATGLDVSSTIYTPDGYRVIAVDPSVIALGSIVRVTLADGDSFEAKAEDTGGDIRGNRIDILVESTDEAFSLGRQSASIEIISEGKR